MTEQLQPETAAQKAAGLASCRALEAEQATVACTREELGLGPEEIVFINASAAEQLFPATLEAWAGLLAAVPGTLLAVAPFAGREAGQDQVASFVEAFDEVLARHGVDDQRLIVFLKDLPARCDVRKFLNLGSVYLDVHPQSDLLGMADALWAGLPAVAWQGHDSASRAAAALLREIDLDELVAASPEELIAKAQRLAADGSWRSSIQKRIVAAVQSQPRFLDSPWYAREAGRALELQQQEGTPTPGIRAPRSSLPPSTRGEGLVTSPLSQAGGGAVEPIDDSLWRGKRVMVYTDLPGIYGVGQYNHALLCELARRGAQAFCVQTEDDNPLIRERERRGVKHAWLSYHTRREFERTFTDAKDPKKLLKKCSPDLIVFSNCSPRSNLAAKRVAMQRGIPFVIAESYVPAELIELPQWTRECDTQLTTQYRAAKQVIAVSRDNLVLLEKQYGMPAGKGVVVHYGRPASYFAPRDEGARTRLRVQFAIPEGATLCLTAARLDTVKGYQYQLRALAKLHASNVWPQLYFAWAGAGPAEGDIREGLRRLGLEDHVRMLGERHDILDWLSAADCFVLTSRAEGMPICIMEAMAKGLPVAATAVSGTPEELGDTGCLLPDPNKTSAEEVAEALAQTLRRWALDGEGRRADGERCQARAIGMFREERMLEETLRVLAEALAGPSAPARAAVR